MARVPLATHIVVGESEQPNKEINDNDDICLFDKSLDVAMVKEGWLEEEELCTDQHPEFPTKTYSYYAGVHPE